MGSHNWLAVVVVDFDRIDWTSWNVVVIVVVLAVVVKCEN